MISKTCILNFTWNFEFSSQVEYTFRMLSNGKKKKYKPSFLELWAFTILLSKHRQQVPDVPDVLRLILSPSKVIMTYTYPIYQQIIHSHYTAHKRNHNNNKFNILFNFTANIIMCVSDPNIFLNIIMTCTNSYNRVERTAASIFAAYLYALLIRYK